MDEPTPEQIAEWKREYSAIYQVGVRGQSFIIRPLTVGEYQVLQGLGLSSVELEERFVSTALLYPQDYDFEHVHAGIITQIADEISHVSGFTDSRYANQILIQKREEAQDIYSLMKALILATMPMYTEEELDALTFATLAGKVALAERILEIQLNVSTGHSVQLELIDPDIEAAKEEHARKKHNASKLPGQADFDDPIARKLRDALGG